MQRGRKCNEVETSGIFRDFSIYISELRPLLLAAHPLKIFIILLFYNRFVFRTTVCRALQIFNRYVEPFICCFTTEKLYLLQQNWSGLQ